MSAENQKNGRKIRVVHYCNQLSIGGTEKTMELFCKYLDRSRFEVFVVSQISRIPFFHRAKVNLGATLGIYAAKAKKRWWNQMNARIPNFVAMLDPDHLIFVNSDKDNELRKTLLSLKPDILHVHYSGRPEPPTSDKEIISSIPVTITTNQFELENTSEAHKDVKRMFFVSEWMLKNKAKWAADDKRAQVFYNPVEMPIADTDLRGELNIPKDAFVIGRVGRADSGIHDPISLKAFQKIQNEKTYFLALSPPENMIQQATAMGLKNFIPLAPTTDQKYLSRFYNTINVLAHARRDGETFGCNIAEAMVHKKPVITHLTPFMNAQRETVGDGGFVCEQDDWQTYAEQMAKIRDDLDYRKKLSEKALARALNQFEAANLTKRLEKTYLELLP